MIPINDINRIAGVAYSMTMCSLNVHVSFNLKLVVEIQTV